MDIRYKSDVRISVAVLSPFVILLLQYIILLYFNIFDTSYGNLIQVLSKVIVSLFYIIAFKDIMKRKLGSFLIIYFIVFFILLLNLLIFPENSLYIQSIIFNLLFVSIPSLIYMLSINNYNVFDNILNKISNILFILGIVFLMLLLTGNIALERYSMSLGYYFLIPLLINTKKYLDSYNYIFLLNTLILLITIISIGSRGPLLSFGVYFILYIIIKDKKKSYKPVLNLFFLTIIFSIGYMFRINLLNKIISFINLYGIESRTLNLFVNNQEEGIYLSGRDKLYEESFKLIKENHFLGKGLAGEISILETYSHNFFIEVLVAFGMFFGITIILSLLILFINVFLKSNQNNKENILFWFSLGFIPLMVSGSYLTYFQFWIFLGLCINLYKINKREVLGIK